MSATGLAVLVALIFRFVVRSTPFRRMVMRYLPKKLRKIDSEMVDMKSELRIMNSKLDAIARHMGVVECADLNIGSNVAKPMGGVRRNLSSSLAAYARVVITKWFTQKTETFRMRGRYSMKKWLRPDSLTVIAGILTVAITRYFNVEIDPTNIIAGAIILLSYFKAHEYVTIVRDANGLPTSFKVNSRKFIFTAVAFGIVVLDEVMTSISIPMELIIGLAGTVTGYNYAEAKKDAKQAETEFPPVTDIEKSYHSA